MTRIRVYTTPREITPRWLRRGDQVAMLGTHYVPGTPPSPARTVDVAAIAELIQWRTILHGPTIIPGVTGSHLLTIAAPVIGDVIIGDGAPTDLVLLEGEQMVVRELVELDPWDVDSRAEGDCGKPVGGVCYLPAGHSSVCDPEPESDTDSMGGDLIEVGATPERVGTGDDLADLVDVVSHAG